MVTVMITMMMLMMMMIMMMMMMTMMRMMRNRKETRLRPRGCASAKQITKKVVLHVTQT